MAWAKIAHNDANKMATTSKGWTHNLLSISHSQTLNPPSPSIRNEVFFVVFFIYVILLAGNTTFLNYALINRPSHRLSFLLISFEMSGFHEYDI